MPLAKAGSPGTSDTGMCPWGDLECLQRGKPLPWAAVPGLCHSPGKAALPHVEMKLVFQFVAIVSRPVAELTPSPPCHDSLWVLLCACHIPCVTLELLQACVPLQAWYRGRNAELAMGQSSYCNISA